VTRSVALIWRAQVDAEYQHALLDRRLGVSDDGVVLVVGLGLVDELLSLVTCYRGQRALLNRLCTIAESGNHRLRVERCHVVIVAVARRRPVGRAVTSGVIEAQFDVELGHSCLQRVGIDVGLSELLGQRTIQGRRGIGIDDSIVVRQR